MTERAGRYRIQVVAGLTGVPAPTLRAWERRHGIPSPARTTSAYRLYSDHDVEMVRRLRDLCAGGMAIAEAARSVRAAHEPTLADPAEDPYASAVHRIVDAVLAFDPESIAEEVSRAVYLGTATAVYDRALSPTLRRIGELWHDGAISIAQEHLASGIIADAARGMARLVQPPEGDRRVLLACFEDDLHDIALHGVAIRLASWGVRSVGLGARTPPEAVRTAVQKLHPDLVGLSVTIPPPPGRTEALIRAYASACQGVPWMVGGPGLGAMAHVVTSLGGIAVTTDLVAARGMIERALATGSSVTGPGAHLRVAEPVRDVEIFSADSANDADDDGA